MHIFAMHMSMINQSVFFKWLRDLLHWRVLKVAKSSIYHATLCLIFWYPVGFLQHVTFLAVFKSVPWLSVPSCSMSQVHRSGWAWNNELTFFFFSLFKGSWIQLFLGWISAIRPVKLLDKLIFGQRRLFLSDENVTLLSHSLPQPSIPRTHRWVGGYSVIILERECLHVHRQWLKLCPTNIRFLSGVLLSLASRLKASKRT